jgi:hypothetical protein
VFAIPSQIMAYTTNESYSGEREHGTEFNEELMTPCAKIHILFFYLLAVMLFNNTRLIWIDLIVSALN